MCGCGGVYPTNAIGIKITHTYMNGGRGGGGVRPGLGNPDDRIAGAKYAWGKGLRPSQPESVMTMMDDDDEGGQGFEENKKGGEGGGEIESGMQRCATHLGIGFVVGGLPGPQKDG